MKEEYEKWGLAINLENKTIKIHKILILSFSIQLRDCEKFSLNEREE